MVTRRIVSRVTLQLLVSLTVWRLGSAQKYDLSGANVVGNNVTLREKEKDDLHNQTIVDPNSNFTEHGFVVGWKVYPKWQDWLKPMTGKSYVQFSLEVWKCDPTDVCNSAVKDISMLTVDQTLSDMVITIPLEKPIAVEPGDCIGYSTRDSYGVIPHDRSSDIVTYRKVCTINRDDNTQSAIEPRFYSIQALVVDRLRGEGEILTSHFYNHKHNIGEGYKAEHMQTISKFQCAAICKRQLCMSYSFDQQTKTCSLSQDNGFAISATYGEK